MKSAQRMKLVIIIAKACHSISAIPSTPTAQILPPPENSPLERSDEPARKASEPIIKLMRDLRLHVSLTL